MDGYRLDSQCSIHGMDVAFHWRIHTNSGTDQNFHSVGALGSFASSKVTIICSWLNSCK